MRKRTWYGICAAFGAVARVPMASPVRGAKGNLEWLVGARLARLDPAGASES